MSYTCIHITHVCHTVMQLTGNTLCITAHSIPHTLSSIAGMC